MSNCTGGSTDSAACSQSQDEAFLAALVTNIILYVVFLALFLVFRVLCKKWTRLVYEPMTDPNICGEDKVFAPPTGNVFFGWFLSAWRITEEEMIEKRGLDLVMYLKLLKTLFVVTIGYFLVGLVILAPIHATAGGDRSGLGILGMGNIPQGSARFAADVIGVYINSLIASVAFYWLYKEYCRLRKALKKSKAQPENFVVLIVDIEPEIGFEQTVQLFDRTVDGKVWAEKVYNTETLWKLLKEREKYGIAWEKAQAWNKKKAPKRKMTRKGLCGDKVDAQDYSLAEYNATSQKISAKVERVKNNAKVKYAARAGFVCFKDIATAQLVSQSFLVSAAETYFFPFQRKYKIVPAPHPEAVEWKALSATRVERLIRSVLVNIAVFLLIFFWMIPVGFASGLSNLETLSALLPFLLPVLDLVPAVRGFIQGFLPGLVLVIFFAILVKLIITPLVRLEKKWDLADVQYSVFHKYFLFLVVNVFLGSIFAAGVFAVLPQLITTPTIIVQLLATSLPKQGIFFTTYLMIYSLGKSSKNLLRPAALLKKLFVSRFGTTKRAQREKEGYYEFSFYSSSSMHCLMFLIISVFSVMNPIILPFGALYFGFIFITDLNNIVYVYTPSPPCHGALFPAVFTRLCWSLVICQLIIGAVLGLLLFPGAAALFVLLLIQLVFWWQTKKQFERLCKYGPLTSIHKEEVEVIAEEFVPAPSAYEYFTLREPLFVAENQDEGVHYEATRRWWPLKWISKDRNGV